MTTIDWAALQKTADDSTRPVPAGQYSAGVTSAESVTASTGSPMIKMKLRIIGGPSDGRMVFHNLVLSANSGFALSLFFKALSTFGMTSEWLQQTSPTMDQIAANITGKTVTIDVGIRAWQGQDRNEIKSFSPADPAVASLGFDFTAPASGAQSMTQQSPMAAQGSLPTAAMPPNPLAGMSGAAPAPDLPI